jgi:hypothetical protein
MKNLLLIILSLLTLASCKVCKNCDLKDENGKNIYSTEKCDKKEKLTEMEAQISADYDCTKCRIMQIIGSDTTYLIQQECGENDKVKKFENDAKVKHGDLVTCTRYEPKVICDK